MIQWEYTVLADEGARISKIPELLNMYGSQGWELIAVKSNGQGEEDDSVEWLYIMKRPVQKPTKKFDPRVL